MTGAGRARRVVDLLGGRFSSELGIDVDADDGEVEKWAVAATLFGARIPARTAGRAYRALADAGLERLSDASRWSRDDLVAVLDEGGYARYDFRTAARLQALARALRAHWEGRFASLRGIRDPSALEAALDALPGWGPVTVRLFLRELRGVWPGADPPLDARATRAAGHLRLLPGARSANPWNRLRALAEKAGLDGRDLEAALVRLDLEHHRDLADCPGGDRCHLLEPKAGG